MVDARPDRLVLAAGRDGLADAEDLAELERAPQQRERRAPIVAQRQEAAAEDPLKRLENELRLKEAELQALVADCRCTKCLG